VPPESWARIGEEKPSAEQRDRSICLQIASERMTYEDNHSL
jgi:hypothetical protein